MKNSSFVILDCETGGFEADKNPITQIAFLILDGETLEEKKRFETFIKPYDNLVITKEALNSTMVKMSDINAGIDADKLAPVLVDIFTKENTNRAGKFKDMGRPLIVGHNIAFDKKFLRYFFSRIKVDLNTLFQDEGVDTMFLSKSAWFHPGYNDELGDGINLTTCCKRMGIKLKDAHGAMADVLATAELFKGFIERLRNDGQSVSEKKGKEKKQREFFEF